MEKVQAIVNKLQQQIENQSPVEHMVITAQMLVNSLQKVQQSTETNTYKKVIVTMPNAPVVTNPLASWNENLVSKETIVTPETTNTLMSKPLIIENFNHVETESNTVLNDLFSKNAVEFSINESFAKQTIVAEENDASEILESLFPKNEMNVSLVNINEESKMDELLIGSNESFKVDEQLEEKVVNEVEEIVTNDILSIENELFINEKNELYSDEIESYSAEESEILTPENLPFYTNELEEVRVLEEVELLNKYDLNDDNQDVVNFENENVNFQPELTTSIVDENGIIQQNELVDCAILIIDNQSIESLNIDTIIEKNELLEASRSDEIIETPMSNELLNNVTLTAVNELVVNKELKDVKLVEVTEQEELLAPIVSFEMESENENILSIENEEKETMALQFGEEDFEEEELAALTPVMEAKELPKPVHPNFNRESLVAFANAHMANKTVYDTLPTVNYQTIKPQVAELNEVLVATEPTVNVKYSASKIEVADILENSPIKDLKKAIGVNDRFKFIKELFRDDEAMYERSLKTIQNYSILPEAIFWMDRELKTKLLWEENNATAKYFYQLVKRRFA